MIETLFGGLLGGVFRLAPEIMKFMDRNNERAHEAAMFDRQLAMDKQRGEHEIKALEIQGDIAQVAGGLDALKTALQGQFQATGVRFIDALNVSVRPVITYFFALIYAAVKAAIFVAAIKAGAGWIEAVKLIWTEADMALWAGILNFYFLGRVFDKRA